MSRFLFSTVPVPGHLDWGGLLKTATFLQAQGHEVIWASGPSVATQLQRAGIELAIVPVAYPGDLQPKLSSPDAQNDFASVYTAEMQSMMDMWLCEEQVASACDAHCDLISAWKPDVVIADPFVIAAALAAESAGIPLAGCGYPGPFTVFMPHPQVAPVITEFNHRRNRLRTRLGLAALAPHPTPEFLFIAPELHLVYFTPEWFARFNPRPSPGAQFVGGHASINADERPAWLDTWPQEQPLVVIARATGYRVENTQLPQIFEALEAVGAFGVIGGALEHRAMLEPLPKHIRWEEWLSYEQILPRAAAIVHHGGTGTTHAALCHGIPQIVIPEAVDQILHADRVMTTGVGLAIRPHQATPVVIAKGLEVVLNQDRFRSAALHMQQHFATLGGISRAAELLVQLAKTGTKNRAIRNTTML